MRSFGGQQLSGQYQLTRSLFADPPRQHEGGNRREDSELYFRLAEASGRAGNHYVGEGGKLAPASQGRSSDQCDHRLRYDVERAEDRMKSIDHLVNRFGLVL